jgi:ankyrin repeat protein
MTKMQKNTFLKYNGHALMDRYVEEASEKLRNKLKDTAGAADQEREPFLNETDQENEYEPTTTTATIKSDTLVTIELKSDIGIVKAAQIGDLARVRELVESGEADPNGPDQENVYLLHWAAINNRLDVARYLIGKGARVDQIGGDLQTTPINWAISAGHLEMVLLFIKNGANLLAFDTDGFSSIHTATINGHLNVVAYLLANGVDVMD